MQTANGPRCDGCKKYILLIHPGKMTVYAIPCTKLVLQSHRDCRKNVKHKAEIITDLVNAVVKEFISNESATEDINEILGLI